MTNIKYIHYLNNKRQTKTFFIILIATITLFSFGLNISQTFAANYSLTEVADSLSQEIDENLDKIDFDSLNRLLEEFSENQKKLFSLTNIKEKVSDVIAGKSQIDYSSFLGAVISLLFELIADYLPMFALIISVGILSNLLGTIKSKFSGKSIGDIIHFVCLCVVVISVSTVIKQLIDNTTISLNSMQDQISVIFPILLTFMTAVGSTASVAVYQPTMAIFSSLSSKIFSALILPIFTLSFCFGIIGNLSNNVKLDKFNSFFNSVFKWLLGILFTIFFALMSIQGISAGSFDSVSIKTMKFTMSSYVPVLGGYLSQGMDIMMASSVLIKNSVGLVGIFILISSILAPILEIVVVSLLFKLASAILQPLGNDKITNFLHTTSSTIIMLSACLVVMSFMYFLMIGLTMATANVI